MKKNIYLTVIWIVTIFCIIGGSCYHIMGWGERFWEHFEQGSLLRGKAYTYNDTLDEFDSISLNVDLSEVNIVTGDKYGLSYKCTKNLVPDFKVKDGTLSLIQNSKNPHFPRRNGNDNCIITITVPKEAKLSRISGGCDLGDVEFDGLTVDEIDIECDLGQAVISDVTASSITCDCNLGNCEITECSFDNLTVNNDMGNIEVVSKNSLNDYIMDLSVSMGGIEVNGEDYGTHYKQKGDQDKKIELTNSMGSISVEAED